MKFKKMMSLMLGATLTAVLCCSCALTSDQKTAQKPAKRSFSPWIVMHPGDDLMELEKYADTLTMISVFGDISKGKNYQEFEAFRKKHGIKTLMAVSADVKAYNTPESRKKTINSWMTRAKERGYDGVDIDIEHMPVESQKDYMQFLKEFSQALHSEGMLLTMCVGFYPPFVETPFSWWYDPANIAPYVDQVRLMAYDCYWAWGKNDPKLEHRKDCYGMGAAANYQFCREALKYWLQYVPKEKLVFSIPAYANAYNLAPEALGKESGNVYAEVNDPIDIDKSRPIHRYWSWVDRVEVIIYYDTEGRLRQQFLCNEKSTKALLELADEFGIESMGVWAYAFNNPQKRAIIELITQWAAQ